MYAVGQIVSKLGQIEREAGQIFPELGQKEREAGQILPKLGQKLPESGPTERISDHKAAIALVRDVVLRAEAGIYELALLSGTSRLHLIPLS